MKFVKPSALLINDPDPFKKIELAGRTCYKSEDAITDESAPKFTRGLIRSKHTAMVEHAVFCFQVVPNTESYDINESIDTMLCYLEELRKEKYFHVTDDNERYLVSANVRAISERDYIDPVYQCLMLAYPDLAYGPVSRTYRFAHSNDKDFFVRLIDFDSLEYKTENEIAEHKNLTFRFISDRGVTHELVRHRPCSFAQESTRYCNYSKGKFGSGLAFVEPANYSEWSEEKRSIHEAFLRNCEDTYMKLVSGDDALTPQQARADLTNCIKTEIVVTANIAEWRHIFSLRLYGTTGAPHPDIRWLISLAKDELREKEPSVLEFLSEPNTTK